MTGSPRHLNIGLSGVRNASSPTALLLTPNGRVKGLIRGGVPAEKISIIPLAYEAPEIRSQKSAAFAEAPAAREVGGARSYPERFTAERPLRVLFLGLINLRKGVARLLEAARILRDEPVEFWMVGPVEIANARTIGDAGE